jgi:hypothetical protein
MRHINVYYRPEAKPKGGLPRVFSRFPEMGMTSPVSNSYVIGLSIPTSPHRPAACSSMVNRKPPLIRKHPLESDHGHRYRRVCGFGVCHMPFLSNELSRLYRFPPPTDQANQFASTSNLTQAAPSSNNDVSNADTGPGLSTRAKGKRKACD